jgi:hypothetical protein
MLDTPTTKTGTRDGSLQMFLAGTSSNTIATAGAIMPIFTLMALVGIG